MIPVDLHSHSLFSGCGVHSVVELLTEAKRRGMAGLAVTDHGKFVGGRANSVFFERLTDPVPGIRLLKGLECNLQADTGETDCPKEYLPCMDIVLLGLHDNLPTGLEREAYTDMLIRALEKNPFVDIVTHPNSTGFPVNYQRLAEAAVRLNVALEMNNSKARLKRVGEGETEALIQACIQAGCEVAVSSDAHVLNELGNDDAIRPLLKKHGFPENKIINRDVLSAFNYIEKRKERKRA
jgi:putative hydrolase